MLLAISRKPMSSFSSLLFRQGGKTPSLKNFHFYVSPSYRLSLTSSVRSFPTTHNNSLTSSKACLQSSTPSSWILKENQFNLDFSNPFSTENKGQETKKEEKREETRSKTIGWKRAVLGGLFVLTVASSVFYYYTEDQKKKKTINQIEETFEKGQGAFTLDSRMARSGEATQKIRLMIDSSTEVNQFLVGSEQSAAVKQALNQISNDNNVNSKGVLYHHIGEVKSFFQELANLIGYDCSDKPASKMSEYMKTLHNYVFGPPKTCPKIDPKMLLKFFQLASEQYKAKHGKNPVLILDNCDGLLTGEEGKNALLEIKNFEQAEGDKLAFRVVFVSKSQQPAELLKA